jgi:POT family proton-dependent oligopeptide transporter
MLALKDHPKALPYLFLTEMWERYGFYVVQGMLVLYMTKAFGFSDNKSYTILGVFTALAYIAPMLGGFLADTLLGFKQAVIWGGIFLILGYGMLALPWSNGFYLALATIIVGNGLFKPNISSLLGALYPPGDAARDSGFTIFYIGINLGVLLSGISSGVIKNHFGWHAAFGLASLGLIIGILTFCLGIKYGGIKSARAAIPKPKNTFLSKPWLIFYCLVTIVLFSFSLQSHWVGDYLLPIVGVLLLFFIFFLALRQPAPYRQQLITLNILIISAVVFWTIYLQMFFSVNLFIDRLVDKQVFGINIPTTVFYALESVFIILVGPGLAWSWQTLNLNNRNPSPFIKFILAIALVGLAFLILGLGTYFYNEAHLINPLWIVVSYFMITLGEMLLSPIGLSAVTMLSPPQLTGMMMGIWFVSLGFGGEFAGWLAKLASIDEKAPDMFTQLPVYRHAFMQFSILAFGVAVGLFILLILFKKVLNRE